MLKRFAIALLLCLPVAVFADDGQANANTILHLLDYIGVDYAEAVADGKVKSEDEYKEMLEFSAQVATRLKRLPDNPQKAALAGQAEALQKLVAEKAPPSAVATDSARLRSALVQAYELRLAPRAAPSLAKAAALYAQQCAACHGAQGRGDGPAGRTLEPRPSNFHDGLRMAQRSVFGLYNTITLGVEGTAMPSFKNLPEEERWALAFFVANLAAPAERVSEGEKLWREGKAREVFPDLAPVAMLSRDEVKAQHGNDAARVLDYLRTSPEVLRKSPIAFAREKLADAANAYRAGDRNAAREAAISAYLEGFELVEAPLSNLDADLMREIERQMLGLRAGIERGAPAEEIRNQVEGVDTLLADAAQRLDAGALSGTAAFTASLIILLREGLEAILVLAAIVAFVVKIGRRDALPWVHAGWIAALALGALTWFAAAFVIDVSGANREMTEGLTALLAAAVLVYVGYWLHGKSYAEAWNRFIKAKVGEALARRTLFAMAVVSFLAVYREMFEIVLFYQALWVQAGPPGHTAVLGGLLVGALALVVVGFAIFKYSVRLPIGPFFVGTSGLLALLAVIFTGHGIAALQEAGAIGVTRLGFEPIPLLGIYPSGESVLAQLLVLTIVVLAFWAARREALSAKAA